MTTIQENKIASVHYTGTFPDSGDVFDSSREGQPLPFLVGHKNMIPGFEAALMGAAVGETREFTLGPEEAYGELDETRVADLPREQFPTEIPLELGMQLMSDIGPFRIVGITDDQVKCDFNHPMAGKTLHFEVEVVDVRDATEEELAHGHAHGPGGAHDHGHEHSHDGDCCDGEGEAKAKSDGDSCNNEECC